MKNVFFALGMMICLVAGIAAAQPRAAGAQDSAVFRVDLSRVDGIKLGFYSGFDFDRGQVEETLKKFPVKLPSPLPEGAELGYVIGPVYGLKLKGAAEEKLRLLVDVNANLDLTDDAWLEFAAVEDSGQATIVHLARHIETPAPQTVMLPYRIWYARSPGRDGKMEDDIHFCPDYAFKGEFRRNGKDYTLDLTDGDGRGRFIREKMVNVSFRIGEKGSSAPKGGGRFFELFPFEKALYNVKDYAEDGSWMEFEPSGLEPTLLGKPAPDFELTDSTGRTFRLSDYKGKGLLLDFWYVWCKPCIAKFPSIKKKLDSLAGKPFAAVGINIDKAARLTEAKKVIADNNLTWRQVVEGKGEYIPAYQIYGRLPENPMAFPIYVAIDEAGVSRYATNDFDKMSRFLDAHFNDPAGPDNTLFVPLSRDYKETVGTPPLFGADYSSPRVKDFIASGKLKLPAAAPKEARIGLLTNGTAVLAAPGAEAGTIRLLVDAKQDFDLGDDKEYVLRVPTDLKQAGSEAFKVEIEGFRVRWASGGMAGFSPKVYAKPAAAGNLWPELIFEGIPSRLSGSFLAGGVEYAVEICDTNGDRLINEFDTAGPGFLKLKVRKGDGWEVVHEGTSRIPIAGALFRLKFASDDGALVELEKER